MSYDDFWNGDCDMAKMYRKAHQIYISGENDLAWLQGFYVYQAVGALAPALKAFSKGRAHKYMEKPIEYGANDFDKEIERQKKQKEEKASSDKAKAVLEMWAIGFNERWDKAEAKKKESEEQNDNTAMNGGETDGRCNDSRN